MHARPHALRSPNTRVHVQTGAHAFARPLSSGAPWRCEYKQMSWSEKDQMKEATGPPVLITLLQVASRAQRCAFLIKESVVERGWGMIQHRSCWREQTKHAPDRPRHLQLAASSSSSHPALAFPARLNESRLITVYCATCPLGQLLLIAQKQRSSISRFNCLSVWPFGNYTCVERENDNCLKRDWLTVY